MNAEAEGFSSANIVGILVDLEEYKLTFWRGGKKQKTPLDIKERNMVWYLTATMFDNVKATITILNRSIPPD